VFLGRKPMAIEPESDQAAGTIGAPAGESLESLELDCI
jgi:hypothetical protein